MEFRTGVCRYCLEKCDYVRAIEGDTKNVLELLLPKLDFSVAQGSGICKNCMEMLVKCYEFKATCLNTHDYILQFFYNKNSIKLDLKDVYLCKNGTVDGVPEDQDICGFCLGLVKNYDTVFLDVQRGDVTLTKMIEWCLPGLDLNIIKKPVICGTCHESLKNFFRFVTNCLVAEGKIEKCCGTLDISGKGEMEPNSFLDSVNGDITTIKVDSSLDDVIKVERYCEEPDERKVGNRYNIIKLEQMVFNDINIFDVEDGENENIIEIDDETISNEQYFMPTDISAFKKENKLISINEEEIFCEDDTKHNEENFVEPEGQKLIFNEEIEMETGEPGFNRLEDAISHLEVLTQKLPAPEATSYKCVSCNQETYELDPKQHPNPSEIIAYRCHSCSTRYQTELRRYEANRKDRSSARKAPPEVTYKCNICSYETKNKTYLTHHLLRHKEASEVTMYSCGSCSFQTRYNSSLKRHQVAHKDPSETREEPLEVTMYACDACTFRTKHKYSLKMHSLTHKDPAEITMYQCARCSYKTKYKSDLQSHLRVHRNTYRCEFCQFQTNVKGLLRQHWLEHRDGSQATSHRCDVCPFETTRRSALIQHSSIHKETVYECDQCTFRTKIKCSFRRHRLVHQDPSTMILHKCDACPFETKRKSTLTQHALKHKDASECTVYACDACTYQTRIKASLKRHKLIHESASGRGAGEDILRLKRDGEDILRLKRDGEDILRLKRDGEDILRLKRDGEDILRLKCDSCPFRTKKMKCLRRHRLMHQDPSEVKMHRCDACPFQTRHRRNLKQHYLVHRDPSEIKMHSCGVCSFRTKYSKSLKSHLLTHKERSVGTACESGSCSRGGKCGSAPGCRSLQR